MVVSKTLEVDKIYGCFILASGVVSGIPESLESPLRGVKAPKLEILWKAKSWSEKEKAWQK